MAGPSWEQSGHADYIRDNWERLIGRYPSQLKVAAALAEVLENPQRTPEAIDQWIRRHQHEFVRPAREFDADLPEPPRAAVEVEGLGPSAGKVADVFFNADGSVRVEGAESPNINTPEKLIEAAGLDSTRHEYIRSQVGVHEIGAKVTDWAACRGILDSVAEGKTTVQEAVRQLRENTRIEKRNLWNVKAWFRQRISKEQMSEQAAQVLEAFKRDLDELGEIPRAPTGEPSGLLACPAIVDVHLGKLAWPGDAGHRYDLKTAMKAAYWTWGEMLKRLRPYSPDRWLLLVGHDLIHFDTETGATTRGTQVDHDGRMLKVYSAGVDLTLWSIRQCLETAPVHVMVVPGNHASMMELTIGVWLERVFGDHPDVEIDASGMPRKYLEWGRVMVGSTHGHHEAVNLHEIVSSEQHEMWGRSVWREMLVGHLHHRRGGKTPRKVPPPLRELQGLFVRNLPAVSAMDFYHRAKGYVGTHRAAEGLVYGEIGLEHVEHVNIVPGSWSPGLDERDGSRRGSRDLVGTTT